MHVEGMEEVELVMLYQKEKFNNVAGPYFDLFASLLCAIYRSCELY